jgi:DNA-binding NtrC family response regulator
MMPDQVGGAPAPRGSVPRTSDVVGDSPGVRAVRAQIERLLDRLPRTRRLPPVLLEGETGTGKGLLARALHRAGPRRDRPFIDVNCAAIPESMLEAEMFGFERGAFTDARQAKPGLLEVADGGMLFLDELARLPAALQPKLLKALEDRSVRRLGSTRDRPVDVWIVAATGEDLDTLVRTGRFRADLYHRLAVFTVRLPPLRERGSDVLLLAEHFLATTCRDYGLPPRRFGEDARAALAAYHWPGNVRELANLVERVALLIDTPLISARDLGVPSRPLARGAPDGRAAGAGGMPPAGPARLYRRALAGLSDADERARLVDALRQSAGNLSRAAARLDIPRNTLRYRLEVHGLRAAPPSRRGGATWSERETSAAALPIEGIAGARSVAPAVLDQETRGLAALGTAVAKASQLTTDGASEVLRVVADKLKALGATYREAPRTLRLRELRP